MKKTAILSFIAVGVITLIMSSSAMSTTFNLTPVGTDETYRGFVYWTSPVAGIIDISGNVLASTSDVAVYLNLVPYTNYTPPPNIDSAGNGKALAGGTPIANTTTDFGSVPTLPLNNSGGVTSLSNWPVNAGDLVTVIVSNFYTLGGATVTVNLDVQLLADFAEQGDAGDLSNPQAVVNLADGIFGNLKPSAGDSVDAYQFYWPGGILSGSAGTLGAGQAGSISGGFQSGLQLDLYSFPSNFIGGTTVLSRTTSDSFNFGSQPAGNYVLQLTDKNSSDDPPYTIQFNGSINAPTGAPSSTVPEPATMLLLGLGLIGLAGYGRKKFFKK